MGCYLMAQFTSSKPKIKEHITKLFSGDQEGNGMIGMVNKLKKNYKIHNWNAKDRLQMHIQYQPLKLII